MNSQQQLCGLSVAAAVGVAALLHWFGPLGATPATSYETQESAQRAKVAEEHLPTANLKTSGAACAERSPCAEAKLATTDAGPVDQAAPPEANGTGAPLERVLASFRTEEPRIEELLVHMSDLLDRAEVLAETVVEADQGGVRGRIQIQGSDLTASFVLDDDVCQVSFPFEEDSDRFAVQMLQVSLTRPEEGPVARGRLGVQSHPDLRDPATVASFSEREEILGWSIVTDAEQGLRAHPIVATKDPSGEGLRIGGSDDDALAPIERPWEWDTRPYEGWRQLLEPYAPDR